MKRNILFSIATILITITGLNAQKIYELNEVDQFPYVDEESMQIITITLVDLYKTAIETPEKFSTEEAKNNTVNFFYDIDSDGVLDEFYPFNGEKYSAISIDDLKKNDRLLFNLTFNESGNLMIPEKIFVISYREITVDRTIEQIGQIAFELKLSESIKSKLKNVKLLITAEVDKNSMTGGLSPVPVLIPFELSFRDDKDNSKETSGIVKKTKDDLKITRVGNFKDKIEGNFIGKNEKQQILEFLIEKSEIMEYEVGSFQFVILDKLYNCNIDINIWRGFIYSSQPKSFSVNKQQLITFSGEGEKLK
uniref:hypothetical protein n=1 Tax=Fulvivirga sp. TaxID=1931237 RepID=UPI004048EF68